MTGEKLHYLRVHAYCLPVNFTFTMYFVCHKDNLRQKGRALAIVQPKQEESLSFLVAVHR